MAQETSQCDCVEVKGQRGDLTAFHTRGYLTFIVATVASVFASFTALTECE